MYKNRRSIRLKDYDYSSEGAYFVTICTQDRELYFENKNIIKLIGFNWRNLKNEFENIDLDEYVIMPNHLHGIVLINNCRGDPCGRPIITNGCPITINRAGTRPAPTKNYSLGNVIGAFKSITTHKYIQNIKTNNWPQFIGRLWQRNYYERII